MDELTGILTAVVLIVAGTALAPYLRKLVPDPEPEEPPKSDEHKDVIKALDEEKTEVEATTQTEEEIADAHYEKDTDRAVVDRAWDAFRKPPHRTGTASDEPPRGSSSDHPD